jgi:hypothetical protein
LYPLFDTISNSKPGVSEKGLLTVEKIISDTKFNCLVIEKLFSYQSGQYAKACKIEIDRYLRLLKT